MEHLVAQSGLDWTIVRPPYSTDGSAQRGYRLERDATPKRSFAMSRIDLAAALLDEVDGVPHVREIIGVASK